MFLKLKNKITGISRPAIASVAYTLCNFLQKGISILTTPIFTRILTSDQYGYYTVFTAWLEILSVFTTLKLAGSVFMQALTKFDDKKEEISSATAGLGTTITIVVFTIYFPFRFWINRLLEMDTLIVFSMFVMSWATLMFEIWADCQRNEYKYKSLMILTAITSVVKPIVGILAVYFTIEYKAEARIISLALVEVIAYTWLFVLFIRRGNFYSRRFWKYLLSLNIPLIPHYLTRILLNQSDQLMIKYMISYSAAGIYGFAHNLAWMLTLIITAILNALNPWIFQCLKKKKTDQIANVSYILLILVAGMGICFITVAPEIVKVFVPPDYYEAMWVIPPLVISVFFFFVYSLFASFEYYYEKTSYLMVASTIGGVINIVLNFIFIKMYGFIAAGYTTLICYVFYAIIHWFLMKKILLINNIKLMYNYKVLLRIVVLTVFLAIIIIFLYNFVLIRYIILFHGLLYILLFRNKLKAIYYTIKTY